MAAGDISFYRYDNWPKSDSCWSLSTGPDGRIYAAACVECTPGSAVCVTRYNEAKDAIDYILEVDKAVDAPRDSGRATQCKIHYGFAPSPRDGILYMATHLSGAPIGHKFYNPWYSWHRPEVFRGSALIAYDTASDKVLWYDTMLPKEGCRCLCYDDQRDWLYSLTYPRDHFVVYDLKTRTRRDVARIGSVNSQAIFLDARRRAYTADDQGYLVRFDPDRGRLETLPLRLPHEHFQTGWHSVLYDAVASPDHKYVWLVTWIADPHLIRYEPDAGPYGKIEDFGRLTQERDTTLPINTFINHAGGLVFGCDGMLYVVASRWREDNQSEGKQGRKLDGYGAVLRVDPQTGSREEVGRLLRPPPDGTGFYVSRAGRDRNGDLFFGNVGTTPVGFFRMRMNAKRKDAHLPLRMWG